MNSSPLYTAVTTVNFGLGLTISSIYHALSKGYRWYAHGVKKVAILGSTGMIGSGLSCAIAEEGIEITEFNRRAISVNPIHNSFHFDINRVSSPSDLDFLSEYDFVVNVAGIIRHKIKKKSREEILNSIHVNSVFPQILDKFADSHPCKIIHVGTDCVYSGKIGAYKETDLFDPTDTYGMTKLLGESNHKNTMTIRVSVVGKELNGHVGLLEWALAHQHQNEIEGYVNHRWNGVTPLQLAKILGGVINRGKFSSGIQHIVPFDSVSKFELIQIICDQMLRTDLRVIAVEAKDRIDRTLATHDENRNLQIWTSAGYSAPPRIEDMIAEYAAWTRDQSRKAGV
jgi:dTDP-4-dehydrorhamnose reductase